MNFTENQKHAIDARDCSLIISAGAGSGKTAVLTERIISRIIDENDDCDITDFLIVTFTNAAAKEMSNRIREKLSEYAANNGSNKKILRNLALLPLAKISTISSFCYDTVKSNFHVLGISPSVRIADDAEMLVLKNELMNETLDEAFEIMGEDEAFITAYEILSWAKSDKGFVEALLDLDKKLVNVTDRGGFCKQVLESYREVVASDEYFGTGFGRQLCEEVKTLSENFIDTIQRLAQKCLENEVLAEKYRPILFDDMDFASAVLSMLGTSYDKLREHIIGFEKQSFASAKMPKGFDDKALKDFIMNTRNAAIKKYLEKLEEYFSCDGEKLRLAADDSERIISVLFTLCDAFQKKLDEKKSAMSMMEFSDAERHALTLLVESTNPFVVTPLAKQLQSRYREIYIDEYQDVNPLQDMIFRAISRENTAGNETNRFMVGDIKQSIYRFRGASADIFMKYRDGFSDIDDKSCVSTRRIFMNDNFRCAKNVIDFTNFIFRRLMGKYYLSGDELIFSRTEAIPSKEKVKLLIFRYNKKEDEGISGEEIEAAIICRQILEYINNPKYTKPDGKTYSLKDVAILAKNKEILRSLESIFALFGIPVNSGVGEDFYAKKEIVLCLDMLHSIDNPQKEIYLAGFMRSFAGGFSDDELALIKLHSRRTKLYDSVISYGKNCMEENPVLAEKCNAFVEKLREYRAFSRGKSAAQLLWKLYTDYDLPGLCADRRFTYDGVGARKNLMKLYQIAGDFSSTGFRGVGAFISYIKGAMEKAEVKAERELSGESVTLMTIHGSKGLEFPICFVCDLSHGFNKSDTSSRLVFSEKSGVATKLCDTEGVKSLSTSTSSVSVETPFRKLIANRIDKEIHDEQARLLYVALTRARDILVLTGGFSKDPEKALTEFNAADYTKDYTGDNFFKMLLSALGTQTALCDIYRAVGAESTNTETDSSEFFECEFVPVSTASELYKEYLARGARTEDEEEKKQEADTEFLDRITRLGSFTYQNAEFCSLPAKLTVSRLKKGLLDEEEETAVEAEKAPVHRKEPVPLFVTGEKKADAAQAGTAMHMFMQFCDFDACVNEGCEKQAERLLQMGFIDERQKNLLDYAKLDGFFKDGIYGKISKSPAVYREQRFNLEISAFDIGKETSESLSGNDILVQGVIDLFFENPDGSYTVIDFKTDRVSEDDGEEILIERHKAQLGYYARAVEEITGKKVSSVIIYSFSLMKCVEIL